MMGLIIGLAGQAAVVASAPVNSRANDLFDRDAALKQWALQNYDANGDGWMTLYEAQPALAAFKQLADRDRDGRITTFEYDRAKASLAARR